MNEEDMMRDRTILRVTRVFFFVISRLFLIYMKKITNEEREKVRGVVVDVRRYHHRRRRPPPSRDRFSDRVSSLSPRASSISTVTKILKTTRRTSNKYNERERKSGVKDFRRRWRRRRNPRRRPSCSLRSRFVFEP